MGFKFPAVIAVPVKTIYHSPFRGFLQLIADMLLFFNQYKTHSYRSRHPWLTVLDITRVP
jgi:hypothetical protein